MLIAASTPDDLMEQGRGRRLGSATLVPIMLVGNKSDRVTELHLIYNQAKSAHA